MLTESGCPEDVLIYTPGSPDATGERETVNRRLIEHRISTIGALRRKVCFICAMYCCSASLRTPGTKQARDLNTTCALTVWPKSQDIYRSVRDLDTKSTLADIVYPANSDYETSDDEEDDERNADGAEVEVVGPQKDNNDEAGGRLRKRARINGPHDKGPLDSAEEDGAKEDSAEKKKNACALANVLFGMCSRLKEMPKGIKGWNTLLLSYPISAPYFSKVPFTQPAKMSKLPKQVFAPTRHRLPLHMNWLVLSIVLCSTWSASRSPWPQRASSLRYSMQLVL